MQGSQENKVTTNYWLRITAHHHEVLVLSPEVVGLAYSYLGQSSSRQAWIARRKLACWEKKKLELEKESISVYLWFGNPWSISIWLPILRWEMFVATTGCHSKGGMFSPISILGFQSLANEVRSSMILWENFRSSCGSGRNKPSKIGNIYIKSSPKQCILTN